MGVWTVVELVVVAVVAFDALVLVGLYVASRWYRAHPYRSQPLAPFSLTLVNRTPPATRHTSRGSTGAGGSDGPAL